MQEDPPAPTDSQVLIKNVPEAVVYVAQHSGFLTDDKIIAARTTNLLEHLEDAKVSFDGSKIFTADYDPPYRLQNRHNEIWVAAAKETQALEAS